MRNNRHNKAVVRFVQGDLFLNWFGHEVTCDEYKVCDDAIEWSFDWDLPVPEGIEETYEKLSGKSCVYWCSETDPHLIGNPSRDDLPRSQDYTTNGYTSDFYEWLEKEIFIAVCVKCIYDKIDIWNSIKGSAK